MMLTLDRIVVVVVDDDNNNYHKMSEEDMYYNNSSLKLDYMQLEIDSNPDVDMNDELNHLFQLLM